MSWSTFKERMGKFFVREENQGRRDALRVQSETNKELHLAPQEEQAEKEGKATLVVKYFRSIDHLERKEAAQLFDILVNIRILTLRHINKIVGIRMEIKHNRTLSDSTKAQLLREIDDYAAMFKKTINGSFQNMTSMESTDVSLSKNMIDLGSQVRELYNAAKRSKKDEKRTRRDETSVVRLAEHSANFGSLMKKYGDDLKEELSAIHTATKYAVILLNKVKQRAKTHHDHMKQLIASTGFPSVIGEDVVKEFEETIQFINLNIADEIKKERIELSEAERAA